MRLTVLYGALFLTAGAVLLAITYALVSQSGSARPVTIAAKGVLVSQGARSGPPPLPPVTGTPPKEGVFYGTQTVKGPGAAIQLRSYAGKVDATFRRITAADQVKLTKLAAKARTEIARQRAAQLDALLTRSVLALGIMAFLSIGLGWLIAGRALRPVRTMSARVRGISERNLHERLALDGPGDELKELGDTFDGLLARLDTAFESQRRFVANASHELRTPITLERTLVEVALADPKASARSLRDTCRSVLAAGEQQERLIEALLTLARSQRGLELRQKVDLGAVARGVLEAVSSSGVRVQSELGEAHTNGDPALVERLVANLIDNAVHYNEPAGWIRAWTGVHDRRPTLRVTNTGPIVSAQQVNGLVEPFRRLNGERAADKHGLGLGLSIVQAIASAHDARLTIAPRPDGGLEVEVGFPPGASVGSSLGVP